MNSNKLKKLTPIAVAIAAVPITTAAAIEKDDNTNKQSSEHNYVIADIVWNEKTIIPGQDSASSNLILLDNGNDVSELVKWKVEEGTDTSSLGINLGDLDSNSITINPTNEALNNPSKLIVGAYINDEKITTKAFNILVGEQEQNGEVIANMDISNQAYSIADIKWSNETFNPGISTT